MRARIAEQVYGDSQRRVELAAGLGSGDRGFV